MDTKSKSNKLKSALLAAILIAAAALGFLSLYPSFGNTAKYYQQDSVANEEIWNQICRSNYVLYKNIQESVQQERLGYEDIYIEVIHAKADEAELAKAQEEEKVSSSEAYIYEQDELERQIIERLQDWENNLLSGLYQQIDYCVIDSQSGKLLKNTDRSPEKIMESEAENPYLYLIRMEYDAGENLPNVSVSGSDSDKLLKNLQALAQGTTLTDLEETLYLDDAQKISIRTRQPANTIFLYGITQEQWDGMNGNYGQNTAYMEWHWSQYDAYSMAGVGGYYALFVMLLMLLVILLPKLFYFYNLQKCRWTRLPLEVAGVLFIIVMNFGQSVISMVISSNNDLLYTKWNKLMPQYYNFTSTQYPGYLILKFMVYFAPLVVLFAAAYWIATSVSVIWHLGLFGYLQERSILYHFWMRTKDFWKDKYSSLKKELFEADLSKKLERPLLKYILINFVILTFLSCLWFFGIGALIIYSIVLFLLIRKYLERIQVQYQELLKITGSIAQGNLNTAMEVNLGVFESYKSELIKIQDGFRNAVDEEVKSQKMKTELITNVSHDLKTPLTAIITYIDLLKEENVTEEQRREYIETLEKKSLRLKVLIEDLFEVSKANSKNITLNPVPLDICNLMTQVYLEHQDKLDAQHLEFRFRMPEEKVILNLDSQKTYRIFENLLINISKYAMPSTRVYVNVTPDEEQVLIEMKNISATELTVNPEELTERFVRGDTARNTEGSGLGLAIARSFIELQNGHMRIETDGDLFKVKIQWLRQ